MCDDHGVRVATAAHVQDVEIAPGLFSPASMLVIAGADDGLPYEVRVTVRPIGGQLAAVDLVAAQLPGGLPVTRTGVASIPVTEMVAACTSRLRMKRGDALVSAAPAPEDVSLLRQGRPDTERLRVLVRIYRIVRAVSDTPGATLQSMLEVDRATITRWLARAVKEGLLDESERGKRKSDVGSVRSSEDVDGFMDAYAQASARDLPAAGASSIQEVSEWLGWTDAKDGPQNG